MPVQTDHLAEEIKELTASVSGIKTEFAGFRGVVETELGLIKWIGVFFAAVLVALVTGAVSIAWNASSLVSEVKQQGGRIDQLAGHIDQLGGRLDQQAGRLDQQAGRLDKIEQQLGQLIQRIDQGGQFKSKQ